MSPVHRAHKVEGSYIKGKFRVLKESEFLFIRLVIEANSLYCMDNRLIVRQDLMAVYIPVYSPPTSYWFQKSR